MRYKRQVYTRVTLADQTYGCASSILPTTTGNVSFGTANC